MNKERIRELAEEIYKQPTLRYRIEMLEEWLEQNQPEPVVVGLSDEQKADFVEYVYRNRWIEIKETLNNWLKTQTFSQPQPHLINSSVYAEIYRDYKGVKKELEQLKAQQFQPDLLEALIELFSVTVLSKENIDAMEKARTAIAKATGRTNDSNS